MGHKLPILFAAGALLNVAAPSAAATLYTSDASFTVANGSTSLTTQSFETAPTALSATSLSFGNVTFSCAGGTYCPSLFGPSGPSFGGGVSIDGSTAIRFVTPSTATFTFAAPITSFEIEVFGLGNNTANSLYLDDGHGQMTAFSKVNPGHVTMQTVGLIDTAGFTSITFSGDNVANSIYFDLLKFGGSPAGTVTSPTASVPEPASWAMMITGFGLAGAALRRRERPAAAATALQ